LKKLSLRPLATADVDSAVLWYEREQPGLGALFVLELDALFDRIRETPQQFPVIEEPIRMALLPRFPYSVYFRSSADEALVLAVLHVSRDPRIWNKRAN
jgi:plasmid stabilization system protein ParE